MTFRTTVSVNSKTLRMISISVWSKTPWRRPSLTRCRISSSETNVRRLTSLMPRTLRTSLVDAARRLTSQREDRSMSRNGPETSRATPSVYRSASAFGTSSPRTSSTYTMARPTRALATSAGGIHADRALPERAGWMNRDARKPPRTPASVPQTVTPICTVARNWSMSSWSAFTRAAARLPALAMPSIRLFRAVITAISLPEKNPFPSRRSTIDAAMKSGSDILEGTESYQRRPLLRLVSAHALW
jgi:hypothetical protein